MYFKYLLWKGKNMFGFKKKKEVNKKWEKVTKLHNDSSVLVYINDAYLENKNMILSCEVGIGNLKKGQDLNIYDCEGNYLSKINIEMIESKKNEMQQVDSADKKVNIILNDFEKEFKYMCGQILSDKKI